MTAAILSRARHIVAVIVPGVAGQFFGRRYFGRRYKGKRYFG